MNVIFLTVDALTYTRLGSGGAQPSPSPTLDGLMGSGLAFSRVFSAGCPTMFAMPAIFTSRLPLDDSGYGMGIRNRGTSFVEVLRDAGYTTGGFCAGLYQGRIYGYDRGFDDYHQLFDLGLFQKILRGLYLDYLTAMINQGRLALGECVPVLEEWLGEFLPALRQYCAEKQEEVQSGKVSASPLLHDRCFRSVDDFVRMEERRFLRDSTGYTARLLEWGHEESVFDILPRLAVGGRLDGGAAAIERELRLAGLADAQPTQGPSASYMVEQLQRWIERRPEGRPWFAWAHLMDSHDLNFISYDCDLPRPALAKEVATAGRLRDALLAARGERAGNVAYDLSIGYVDGQIARLLGYLEERGLRDKTLLVIHSDHGGWKNGYPERPADAGYMSFYDEMYHVPLLFSHPDIAPRTVDALASSLDVAPTLLDLLGLPIPPGYRGEVASDPAWSGRPYVLMEHMGSGPCDFVTKNLHLCLRTESHKLVCETPPLWQEGEGALRELYHLATDPLEQENLAGVADFPEELVGFVGVVEDRLRELHDEHFRVSGASAGIVSQRQ